MRKLLFKVPVPVDGLALLGAWMHSDDQVQTNEINHVMFKHLIEFQLKHQYYWRNAVYLSIQ